MGKLGMFDFMSLNGYFEGPKHDISWHRHGEEESAYAVEGLKSESILLFGRKTYAIMASFWPTPMGMKSSPAVAEGMNKAEKIVFSRKLKKAEWNNTRIIGGPLVPAVKKLKESTEKDLTILGSGSIVTQLADAGLIDTYQIMIDPVALGRGTTLFQGLKANLDLRLTATRTFRSGVVLLIYEPM